MTWQDFLWTIKKIAKCVNFFIIGIGCYMSDAFANLPKAEVGLFKTQDDK